ncbi:hypothetical protein BGZ95_005402 [Linnemannia exigua]|uniref:F-box domain-containing protein n=1 Tax=Linnemannia exigua TaxID=604196 RepID=A0AAD4DMZ5_9FUNG|nr:hypothetical protein BGZ95_005402 [Linnemannia exigua]
MSATRTSPSLATFSCPELCHIIALHLKQTDLYSCLLVNKTLSKNLFPYLWRHITFHDFEPYYSELYVLGQQKEREQEKQRKNNQAGEDSELKEKDNDEVSKAPTFATQRPTRKRRPFLSQTDIIQNPWAVPSKQRDVSDFYFPFSPPYSQLIKHGHLIETLTLEWNEGLDYLTDAQLEELEELPESKQEEPPGHLQSWTYIRLMEQCTNVRVLEVAGWNAEMPHRYRNRWVCGTGMRIIYMARQKRLSAKDEALAKVVEAAGRLGFGIQAVSSSSSTKDVAPLPDGERAPLGPTGIQEFHLSGSCGFRKKSFNALISAFSPSPPLPPPAAAMSSSSILPDLYPHQHHQAQLRVLDISGCEFIQSDQMHTLLTSLPGLQVIDLRCRQHLFELFPSSGLEYDFEFHQSVKKEEESPVFAKMTKGSRDKGLRWACQDSLRVLRVGVKDVSMGYEPEIFPSMTTAGSASGAAASGTTYNNNNRSCLVDVLSKLAYPACFHWLYDSIAPLTNLRELCLVSVKDPVDCDPMNREVCLSLEEGLDRWEGLKELEVLDVEYLNHQIGIREVQWMVKCWPRLKVIRGLVFQEDELSKNEDTYVDVEMKEDEKDEEKERRAWSEGVRWLKATRPDIELPVLEKRWKGAFADALPEEDNYILPEDNYILPEDDDDL